ncbi:MAG: 2OG-Fe(II) oxygenase, partial [Planctomycetota bacterium]|nr:2OG-Fe(II) oxygenase [Planctomycetota bacterium]
RTLAARLADRDWEALRGELLGRGWFRLRALLSAAECAEFVVDAGRENRFERSIVMAPRGYGVGAYHYFREPLAEPAGELRGELYTRLRPAARELSGREYPATLAAFWRRCRAAGQHRSSSIVLCYGKGGVNHPHRDIYGDEVFPFQALVPLMVRGRDFSGGEFLLYEETARGDVRHEIRVDRGDLIVFATRERLNGGGRRPHKVPLRHGMATVTRGERAALGIVFNLAS